MICALEPSFTTPLRHDQHLPDQPGSSAGASAAQQATLDPRPGAASIAVPQQASHQPSAHLGAPAITAVCRGIHVSLLQQQYGK